MAEPSRPKPIPRKLKSSSSSSHSNTPSTPLIPVCELPEELVCPVCRDIINNPMLLSCCGVHLCGSCVVRIEESPLETRNHCPYCLKEFETMPHRGIQRKVNEVQMYCPNFQHGCSWIGDFSKVDAHLDKTNPQLVHNCPFQMIACRNSGCTATPQRSELSEHENEECPLRPYKCPHCEQYESTYVSVCQQHFSICESFPTVCPNKCSGNTIPRGLLSEHLSTDCLLEEVACEFSSVGCHFKKKRGELYDHSETNAHYHNSLLLKELTRVKNEMEERTDRLQVECQDLREKNKRLTSELAVLKVESHTVYEELEDKIQTKKSEKEPNVAKSTSTLNQNESTIHPDPEPIPSAATLGAPNGPSGSNQVVSEQRDGSASLQKAVQEIRKDIQYIEKWISPSPPFAFTFSKFESHRKNNTAFMSGPFYTRVRGYKMCVKVIPSSSPYVGVYCCIMRGEHDDHLKWPFRGIVHIKLQNQLGDCNHLCGAIRYDQTISDSQAGRVKTGDKNYLHGYPKFISVDDLKVNLQLNRQYLKGDALDFEVTKVEELNSS